MAYDGILEPILIDINSDAALDNPRISLPAPPSSGGGEQTYRHSTLAPSLIGAGGVFFVTSRGGAFSTARLEATLTVANMAGTQVIVVASGPVMVSPSNNAVKVPLDLTRVTVGTDLSYDSATSEITTAAGGVFMATLEVDVSYVAP